MNLYCFNRYILSFFIDHLLGVQVTVFSTYTHTHSSELWGGTRCVLFFFIFLAVLFFCFFFALQCSPSDERRLSNQRWAEKLDDCFDIIFFCLPIFSSPLVRFSSICDLFAPMNLRPSIKKNIIIIEVAFHGYESNSVQNLLNSALFPVIITSLSPILSMRYFRIIGCDEAVIKLVEKSIKCNERKIFP